MYLSLDARCWWLSFGSLPSVPGHFTIIKVRMLFLDVLKQADQPRISFFSAHMLHPFTH
jgi:hypothetical protein